MPKETFQKQYYRVCFCFSKTYKVKTPEPPDDVKILFELYSENGTMTIDDLLRFLVEVQGEYGATRDDAQAIFNSLRHHIFHRRGLHLQAFFRYLMGDANAAISPSCGVHHDMNAPLAHYFLYTGHNSYLTGNQVSSDSSPEPIKRALQRGVRVIELDLWPNSKNDNVEVRHGGTLTAPADLIKCLRAIKDNAFEASEYPVIITFEDHLTPNLQAKVAKMVTKVFGDMLFIPKSDQFPEFPSPESLKKKVLISTKPPEEYLASQSTEEKESEQGSRESSEKEDWTDEEMHGEEHLPEEDEEMTVPEYRHMIAIHAGKLKGGIENWLSINPNKVRRLSLSEQELENATRTHGTEIVRFTQRNLLRVYPRGLRLDSSNYDPFIGWMHGAQMVAFNMQDYRKFLWIMQGMFRANGQCGYVKKPDFLLNADEVFDPRVRLPVKQILKGKVFTGEGWESDFGPTHFDTYSPPDFMVKVAIAGVPYDKAKKETQVIEDNWHPTWNEEFEFKLTVPELAVLRIEVWEYDTSGNNDFGGQTCLPVSELRTGIRSVPLHDRKGNRYKFSRLLMQFQFD